MSFDYFETPPYHGCSPMNIIYSLDNNYDMGASQGKVMAFFLMINKTLINKNLLIQVYIYFSKCSHISWQGIRTIDRETVFPHMSASWLNTATVLILILELP